MWKDRSAAPAELEIKLVSPVVLNSFEGFAVMTNVTSTERRDVHRVYGILSKCVRYLPLPQPVCELSCDI